MFPTEHTSLLQPGLPHIITFRNSRYTRNSSGVQKCSAMKPPHYTNSNSFLIKAGEWDTVLDMLETRDTQEASISFCIDDFLTTELQQILQSKYCIHTIFSLILRVIYPDLEQRLNIQNVQKGFLMINKEWSNKTATKQFWWGGGGGKRKIDKKLITFQTLLLNNKDEKGRETPRLPFEHVVSLNNQYWGWLWGGSPRLGERSSTFTRNKNKCFFFLIECSSSAHAWPFVIGVNRWIIYSEE